MSGGRKARGKERRPRRLRPATGRCVVCGRAVTRDDRTVGGRTAHEDCYNGTWSEGRTK